MAGESNIQQASGNELNAVGEVQVVHNTVRAEGADGSVRILEQGSQIFMNDRILTGPDGSISIVFGDAANVQLDLGRESDVVIDEDVYLGSAGSGVELADVTADIEQIQQAILEGDDVQIEDLPATAAGPAGPASAGGGTFYTEFTLTGDEVTPESGAETTGVGLDFLDPEVAEIPPGEEEPVVLAAAAPPPDTPPDTPDEPENTVPIAGDVTRVLDESELSPHGTNATSSVLTTSGTLADLGVDFGDDLPGTLNFGGGNSIVIDSTGGDSITINGLYGTLTVNDDGTWTYTQSSNAPHTNTSATGVDDIVSETFNFLAEDEDGDSAPGSITVSILDDGPSIDNTGSAFFVSEWGDYNNIIGTYELDDDGNPINVKIVLESTDNAIGPAADVDPSKYVKGENETLMDGDITAGTKLFIIANGASNSSLLSALTTDGAKLTIVENGSGGYTLAIDGTAVTGYSTFFMDAELNADGQYHFKDENGDFISEVSPEGGEIRVEDLTIPESGSGTYIDWNDAVFRVEMGPVVSEANLADGTDPDPDATTIYGNFYTGEGGITINSGADHDGGSITVQSYEITADNSGSLVNNSKTVVLDGDNTHSITVATAAGELTIYGDGTWSYELIENTLVHPDNDPGGADKTDGDSDRGSGDQVQDIFDLVYADSDGDSAETQLIININDDGPEVGTPQDSLIAIEDGNYLTADLDINAGADGLAIDNAITLDLDDGDDVTTTDGYQMTLNESGLTWHYDSVNSSWSADNDSEETAFTVKVDDTTGTYKVEIVNGLDSLESGDEQTIELSFNVEDGDGDAASGSFTITFDDDNELDASDADGSMVIAGSSGNDVITGSDFDDTIFGGDGDDTINAGSGDDTVYGQEGNDTIYGEEGSDTIDGGVDNDILDGGTEAADPVEGNDTVTGGDGADTFDQAEYDAGETDYDGGLIDSLVPEIDPDAP